MDILWTEIANYGFPMAIAVFLLVRVENKLDNLTEAIARLGEVISRELS